MIAALLAPAPLRAAPSLFSTFGPAGDPITRLGVTLTVIGSVVCAAVTLILLYALLRPRPGRSDAVSRDNPPGAIRFIVVGGILVPIVILAFTFGFSMATQAEVAAPPTRPTVEVAVYGHRWWWELRYVGARPDEGFVTANELHVPVGTPVHLRLMSTDVIHSFWVPQLAGKTDVVPGQNNEMWIQADRPGTYLGKCAEYCGLQHAQMYFSVVAESPARYAAWAAGQRETAVEPAGLYRPTPPAALAIAANGDPALAADALAPAAPAGATEVIRTGGPAAAAMTAPQALVARGRNVFLERQCAACHAIRGTNALGRVGPDLTHLASRRTIAAGVLPNTRGNLGGWISNSQAVKPGNLMPTIPLSGPDLQALLAYLETLR